MHHQFVLFAQFVDTEDGNDVLQFAVALERALHAAGDLVVPLAHILRIKDAAGGSERIDGRIDALLRDRTLQIEEGVEIAKRGSRGRIGRIISRHVDSLHGGDGSLLRARDPLLQGTHLRGERGLVADGAGHTAQQRAHFAPCLREPEDIVDKQQRVGPGGGGVAEVFGHGEGREGDAETGSWRLIHLPEHHACLVDNAAAGVADFGLLHFQPEIGSFAGSLPHPGKH